jgi:hypothetical protein
VRRGASSPFGSRTMAWQAGGHPADGAAPGRAEGEAGAVETRLVRFGAPPAGAIQGDRAVRLASLLLPRLFRRTVTGTTAEASQLAL